MSAEATVLRTPGGRFSVRLRGRAAAVCVLLVAAIALVGLGSVCVSGDVPFSTALATLSGHGTRGDEFILYTLRVPRMLCAVAVGLALGAGGAIFQSLLRNPLGSPDVIGFTTGSSAGAVVAITFFQATQAVTAVGALAGGLAAAAAVYLLTLRRGSQGYRLILVGIAVSLMLTAFVNYLLTRVALEQAVAAQIWLVGSLNGRGWEQAVPALAAVAALLPLACGLTRRLALLEMGDDAARSLGVPAEPTRRYALLVGVALVATATATAGPVAFVALSAPQLARRLTRAPTAPPFAAALVGALLVTAADWIAQSAFSAELPVGVATGAVGGLYLAWLLNRERRRQRSA